jgi:hypothetical protein
MPNLDREGKSQVAIGKMNSSSGKTSNSFEEGFVRRLRDMKHVGASLEVIDTPDDVKSLDIASEPTLSRDEFQRVRGRADKAPVGKSPQSIEILSSDQSSDDCLLTSMKYLKHKKIKQNSPSIRNSGSRGRPASPNIHSPAVSRESSHLMNYSYEEDTLSLGGFGQANETSYSRPQWPADEGDVNEGGSLTKSENHNAPSNIEALLKYITKQGEQETSEHEGDESNDEDLEGSPIGTETDGEELPVLPKVPVKRKLLNEAKGGERKIQRGRPKSGSPQLKKQKTPQIDASVITQLEFGRRPQNCVSIANLWLW